MLATISISPVSAIHGSIRPPGSKSLTNRALICAALAEGKSQLTGALASEDTHVMIDSLQKLGIAVAVSDDGTQLIVAGCGGKIPATQADLFVANSGTTIRFLTAMVALGHGKYRLDGVPRMRERPIGDLLDALNALGAHAVSETNNGCPPVTLKASGLRGGEVTIRGDISSQFLSGLLMAAPCALHDVQISVEGELVSQPYVRMTLALMHDFGVETPAGDELSRLVIRGGQAYISRTYEIEPDASAASYFWGAAAVTGGSVLVEGLTKHALQGDVAFCDCLEKMGCHVEHSNSGIRVTGGKLHGVDVNMNAISDTAQTLAVVALFAEGPTTIRGIGHNRHKETDRIGDLARELRKLGATVEEFDDGFRVIPGPLRSAQVATYNDHRMAMSLALAGLRVPGVVVENPECTSKTYPGFWNDLSRLAGVKFVAQSP